MANNIFQKVVGKVKEVVAGDGEKKTPLSIDDSNETTLNKVRFRKDEAEKMLFARRIQWQNASLFFDGEHWLVSGVTLPTYKADIVINKFFAAVRSLVAFETDTKPDPEVEARIDKTAPNATEVIEAAKKVESMLDYRWDMIRVPITLTEIYYDRYLYDDGFGMYFWNAEIDDVDFEQVKPQDLFISPGATNIDDAEYIIVRKWRSRQWVEKFYPELVDNIKFEGAKREEYVVGSISGTGTIQASSLENMAPIYHYFENDIWVTFTEQEILEKMKNPYWEWRTEEEQRAELVKEIGEERIPDNWKPIRNHLQKPEKPVIQFKGYHLGGEFYSRSLFRQVMKLNMALNKRKAQIQDNADGMGNGQWIIDPSVPESEIRKITSEPGLKIRINPALAKKEMGIPLAEFVFADMQHTEQKFDDMMGHHEISRGGAAAKRQTAREALLLRETDITPVRLLMRNSEAAMSILLNGWIQLQKLFYDQKHYIGQFGTGVQSGIAGSFLTRDEIPDNLSLIIRIGSTLPVSKEQKRVEFQNDLQRGVLDPLTYLELMEYPNPRKILERVLNWQKGIVGEGQQQPAQVPGQPPQQPPQAPQTPV